MSSLVCWKCGASLGALTLPLQRSDECPVCRAQLHVCRLCEFYDTRVARQCREPIADDVRDKDRSNFCGYFSPRMNAYSRAGEDAAAHAQKKLGEIFGSGLTETQSGKAQSEHTQRDLEDLFKKR